MKLTPQARATDLIMYRAKPEYKRFKKTSIIAFRPQINPVYMYLCDMLLAKSMDTDIGKNLPVENIVDTSYSDPIQLTFP